MQELLPRRERYFKVALHVHTDVSDGFWTPEELKEHFKSQGYSAVAFSDHNLITDQSCLSDSEFLALTAYEMGVSEHDKPKYFNRVIHMNFLAPRPGFLWQAHQPNGLFARSGEWLDRVECGELEPEFGMDFINAVTAQANERGFLATYNHPDHMDTDGLFRQIKGLWGVEIFNHDSRWCGQVGYYDHEFQQLLLDGQRVFPVASDDCHSRFLAGLGKVMVGATELSYDAIMEALVNGDGYSTTGPEIYSLTQEGHTLRVTCSDAIHIALLTHCRFRCALPRKNRYTPVQEVEFDLAPWFESILPGQEDRAFFRLVLTDAQGNRAYTRAYWRDELREG